jgi:hypothetical protein
MSVKHICRKSLMAIGWQPSAGKQRHNATYCIAPHSNNRPSYILYYTLTRLGEPIKSSGRKANVQRSFVVDIVVDDSGGDVLISGWLIKKHSKISWIGAKYREDVSKK